MKPACSIDTLPKGQFMNVHEEFTKNVLLLKRGVLVNADSLSFRSNHFADKQLKLVFLNMCVFMNEVLLLDYHFAGQLKTITIHQIRCVSKLLISLLRICSGAT